jgi:2',3'-cyclic-nucleotide 2'-phosphodiesterase (5'-nucleotidase family)
MKYLEKIKQNSLYFALFLIGLSLLASCKTKYEVSKITGRKITVNANLSNDAQIESFIAPYAQKINQDMNRVLAFNPETLDKSIALSFGQSKMSNWFADVTFERTNLVLSLKKINPNKIDLCLLNSGGIRAPLPKGDVTTRQAFELMPFENSIAVLGLKGSQIFDLMQQIIKDKKPHPLSGIKIFLAKDYQIEKIEIGNQPIAFDKIYYLATTDYTANGGDGMDILTKAHSRLDLDYKLRNLLIDYFEAVDQVNANDDIRIIIKP